MKNSSSWLTPKQAGVLLGYSARYVQTLITKGKLPAVKEDGKYYIDKAEFFRLFPDAHRKEQEANPEKQMLERVRMEVENEMLKDAASKKEREIEFLRNQLENFNSEKAKMLEAITYHARLLEHKEGSKVSHSQEQEKQKQTEEKKSWRNIFKTHKD